jgi:hypothetical protein
VRFQESSVLEGLRMMVESEGACAQGLPRNGLGSAVRGDFDTSPTFI